MKQLLRILVIHSAKDLFKYKSFFLLVFLLILLDRGLRQGLKIDRSALQIPSLKELGLNIAPYIFEELPPLLWEWLTDYRTLLVIIVLFLVKQLISMWPSSDMRRMHRQERGRFGLIGSLLYLRWQQVLWDAIALFTLCGGAAIWIGIAFGMSFLGWQQIGSPIWLLLLGGMGGLSFPLLMAGFSYSSKLAVLSEGTFIEKLSLFYRLFLDWGILWRSWVFYLARIVVEFIFVAAIPIGVILTIEQFWLRISLASLSATPVYSYLKMASFKFFLEIYRDFPQVRVEYRGYFDETQKAL